MIKRGIVSLSREDTGTYGKTQASYLGKVSDVEVVYPYGLAGRLPTGASLVIFNNQAHEEDQFCIGNTPQIRFRELAEGEVAFGNPLTESVVYMRENGDMEIIVNNNVSETVTGNVTEGVGGTITTQAGSSITVTAGGEITFNPSSRVVINGDLRVTGDIEVVGDLTINEGLPNEFSMTGFQTTYNTHTHDENGSVTDAPNQTIP